MSSSPICTVNSSATTNGVNVAGNTSVTISLASSAGVTTWSLSCIGTDDLHNAATINSGLTINPINHTATFTSPSSSCALLFRSTINGGLDQNGAARADYSCTFGVYVLTNRGLRIGAIGETFEGNASFGWTSKFNAILTTLGTYLDLFNTAFGFSSLASNVSGQNNTAIGYNALAANTGSNNTAIGKDSLAANTSGTRNVSVGVGALASNATTGSCVAVGVQALTANVATYSVAVGDSAGISNTSGSGNTFIGAYTGYLTTSQGFCTYVGCDTGHYMKSEKNTAIGHNTMRGHTTLFGTGGANTAVGQHSMVVISAGSCNSSLGVEALQSLTEGHFNVALGLQALRSNLTGSINVAVGCFSLMNNIAAGNTAVGHNALINNTSGTANTALGESGTNNTTGSYNVFLGSSADLSSSGSQRSRAVAIGYNAKVDRNDAIVLGRVDASVNVGIATVAPTARLHLPAGGTAESSAALKLTAGSTLTTPEAGAIEFDGTHLYFTKGDGTRMVITATVA